MASVITGNSGKTGINVLNNGMQVSKSADGGQLLFGFGNEVAMFAFFQSKFNRESPDSNSRFISETRIFIGLVQNPKFNWLKNDITYERINSIVRIDSKEISPKAVVVSLKTATVLFKLLVAPGGENFFDFTRNLQSRGISEADMIVALGEVAKNLKQTPKPIF